MSLVIDEKELVTQLKDQRVLNEALDEAVEKAVYEVYNHKVFGIIPVDVILFLIPVVLLLGAGFKRK